MARNQTNPTDTMIQTRDRTSRWLVAIATPIVVFIISFTIVDVVVVQLLKLPLWLGWTAALAASIYATRWFVEQSIIVNESVQAFVTVNPLASLLNTGSSLVSYGPGTHIAFWWEQRIAKNNIGLSAVPINIGGTVQTIDGTITKRGGVRLRPNITQLNEFISGLGSVPDEISGLVEAEIVVWLSDKDVKTALEDVKGLNEHLKKAFVDEEHPLEKRYGILIDDVTINELLPSKEIQETMGSKTENRVINEIVAETFGYKDIKALNAARKRGTVSEEAITRVRTEVMAMSGNLQGMQLSRSDFNVNLTGLKDLDPEIAKNLANAMTAYASTKKTAPAAKNPQKGGKK